MPGPAIRNPSSRLARPHLRQSIAISGDGLPSILFMHRYLSNQPRLLQASPHILRTNSVRHLCLKTNHSFTPHTARAFVRQTCITLTDLMFETILVPFT